MPREIVSSDSCWPQSSSLYGQSKSFGPGSTTGGSTADINVEEDSSMQSSPTGTKDADQQLPGPFLSPVLPHHLQCRNTAQQKVRHSSPGKEESRIDWQMCWVKIHGPPQATSVSGHIHPQLIMAMKRQKWRKMAHSQLPPEEVKRCSVQHQAQTRQVLSMIWIGFIFGNNNTAN